MSGVQSIERAFLILGALAVGPAGVTDLAERCDIPKSTVARLLGALEAEGAVEQVESWGEYRLGSTILDLAGAAAPGHNLISAARPHLTELTRVTGETAGLSVLDEGEVLYLDHVESTGEVQVRSWTGERLASHLVPSGLVLLAGQPDDVIDTVLTEPLGGTTERSVTDPQLIRKRIADLGPSSIVWMHGEFDDDINSVSTAVIGADGAVVAALHIHGPAYRFPADDITADEVGELLQAAAARLSRHLA